MVRQAHHERVKSTMKRWMALHRWLLLWVLIGSAAGRVLLAIAFRLTESEAAIAGTAKLVLATAFDVALLGLAVLVLIAFVQYGRIYNARIPTE